MSSTLQQISALRLYRMRLHMFYFAVFRKMAVQESCYLFTLQRPHLQRDTVVFH